MRLIVSAHGGAVAAVSGYIFGVLSFYTNFFDSILQATAVLVDTLAVLIAIALVITGALRRILRRAGRIRTLAGSAVALALVAAVNYYGIRPPGVLRPPQDEVCVYDVTAGEPIPLAPGGSITQEIRPQVDEINSVSVIAGLDDTTAHRDRAHPIKLRVRTQDGSVNTRRERDDIVDNAFSRFEFAEPLEVNPRDTLFIQVFNDANEAVSVYVKQPEPTDVADGATADVYIAGHVGNESGYRKAGYVLSGCVTGPGRA